jgi:fructosamine-3-kinase
MTDDLRDLIKKATGAAPAGISGLGGGCVGEVYRVQLDDGRDVVVKLDQAKGGGTLDIEGAMLRYLADHSRLPVPGVIHASPDIVIMDYIENDGGAIGPGAERHGAELLAELHAVTAPKFGFATDTLIGGLIQPGGEYDSWRDFFRDRRLIHMGKEALDAGHLAVEVMGRVENFAADLDQWIEEPESPSLIHGDVWGGNVLVRGDRIAGFVDPAIYYADAEIELAFSTLFSTFSDAFFARYNEIRPIKPGFFEERRDIYNLYPLLVHTRLFGGHYAGAVERTLKRFGY